MKHGEFLKQVKERAEGGMDILREPPLSAETARLQMVIRSGRPDDVLKLLAIIEKLKGELEFTEHLMSNGDGPLMALWKEDTDKELDEIVGQG